MADCGRGELASKGHWSYGDARPLSVLGRTAVGNRGGHQLIFPPASQETPSGYQQERSEGRRAPR